jgi:hypothetical protein
MENVNPLRTIPAWRALALLALLAVLACVPAPARAQGTVNFRNKATGVDAPDFDVDCTTKLSGSAFSASLYASPNPDPASMVALGSPTVFLTGILSGYYNGGTRTIPGIPPGAVGFFQVRVWESACGATFEQALAIVPTCKRAVSQVFAVQTGDGFSPPPELVGLNSFCLTGVGPTISAQPQRRTVVQGANYTFSVTATGTAPLNYQWRFNGNSVAGGTNATLPRTNIQFSDAGDYRVVVSNAIGAVTSVLATLTVRATNDPVYAAPHGDWTYLYDGSWTTVTNGTNIGGAKPTVTLDGQWSASSGSSEWAGDARGTNNGPIGGISTNNGILTIEDINFASGSNNNRKIYFTRDFSRDSVTTNAGRILDQGITLTFRTRLTQPGVIPASDNPTNSLPDGYGIFSDGKANFNVRQRGVDSIIGFSLVRSNEPDNTFAFNSAGLTMNALRGNAPSGNGFVNSSASAASNQVLALDPNQFHEFWITIQTNRTGGAGTHTVDIFRDGSLVPATFNLTAGTGSEDNGGVPLFNATNYLALGLNNSAGRGVIDVDFFGYKQGVRHPAGFNDPVAIISSPQSQTVLDGTPVTLAADVTGTPPYFFQWFANNVPIAGATNQNYSLVATVNDSGKTFFLTVSNLFSAAASSNAVLNVAPLFIVTQPMSTNVGTGGNVTFTAAAIGAPPLSYQWRWNGVNLVGATNSSYTVFDVHSTNAGVYSVVIRNAAGAVLSDDAELFVFGIGGPSEDNFADRLQIFNANSEIRGITTGATNEVGEPAHAGIPARHSIWYTWQMPNSGIATFDTRGSTFDSVLAVYTGTALSNLVEIASDDDRGGNLNALVRFNVASNTFYHIAVDGFGGASGNSLLNWSFESTAAVLPVITNQPLDRTVLAGTNVSFSVGATGTGLKYLWFLNGGPLLGSTGAVLVVSNVQPPKVGAYTVRITNNVSRGVESRAAVLEIGPVPAVRSRDKVEDISLSGGSTNLIAGPKSAQTVAATGSTTPPLPVSMGAINSQVFNNTDATTSQHENPPCGQIGGSSKWFGLLADQDGYFVADTYSVNTTIDTVMAVYKSTSPLSPLVFVTCDDNSAPDGIRSRVVFAAERNVDYLVAVDGVGGARGGIQLNVALGRLPVLASAPANQLVPRGGHHTFSVAWSNAVPEPGVLWLRNGAPLPAATNASLTLSNLQPTQAGNYRVVLSNAFGAVSNGTGILLTVADLLPQTVGGQLQLRLSGATGPGFVMQVSTDMTTWTPAYIHTAFDGTLEYVTNIVSRPRGFYRAAP